MANLKNDEEKLKYLDEIKYESEKVEIAKSIRSDRIKLQSLEKFTNSSNRLPVARTIKKDSIKIQAINKLENDLDKEILISSLKSDFLKLKYMDRLNAKVFKGSLVMKIKNDYIRIKALEKNLNTEIRMNIIESLGPRAKKKVEQDFKKIKEITSEPKGWIKIDELSGVTSNWAKVEIAKRLSDQDILKALKMVPPMCRIEIIQTIETPEIMVQALDMLEQFSPDKIETLKRMYQKNNEILQTINFDILDSKYIETLGEDSINLISCFPEIQNAILNLDSKSYTIFYKCIDNYLEKNKTEEWTVLANNILANIRTIFRINKIYR